LFSTSHKNTKTLQIRVFKSRHVFEPFGEKNVTCVYKSAIKIHVSHQKTPVLSGFKGSSRQACLLLAFNGRYCLLSSAVEKL
jgi:hypothetical protein